MKICLSGSTLQHKGDKREFSTYQFFRGGYSLLQSTIAGYLQCTSTTSTRRAKRNLQCLGYVIAVFAIAFIIVYAEQRKLDHDPWQGNEHSFDFVSDCTSGDRVLAADPRYLARLCSPEASPQQPLNHWYHIGHNVCIAQGWSNASMSDGVTDQLSAFPCMYLCSPQTNPQKVIPSPGHGPRIKHFWLGGD